MTTASGSFTVASWQEETYEEGEGGAKLTRATVSLDFSGGIEGRAAVQWLMSYRPDGTAHFVGLARVTGRLAGPSGSFVLENTGEFDGTVARGEWSVVAGSGTGELEGLRGAGGFEAGQEATYTLDYELG
ncbi:MAG TPA: DUF3224 domain-containing protein [Acidimicrobiales bacterium]|nr:DUF3224 domain-containing protein [Acidimicrobiales bacterium]